MSAANETQLPKGWAERDPSTVRSRLLSLKPHLADLADDCLETMSHLTPAT